MRWGFGVNPLDANAVALPLTVLGITVEQLFEERMFALSQRTDGVVLSVVSSLLLLAGLLMDFSGGVAAPVQGFYAACGAGLGAVISVAAAYGVEPMRAFSLKPVNIAFFPRAAVQSLLFPAVGLLLRGFTADFFAALAIWRIARTLCRRSHDESRPLNLLLTAVCGLTAVAALWFAPLAIYAAAAACAMLCAVIVFCAPGWRIYAGAALIAAACAQQTFGLLPAAWTIPVVLACSAAAVILNLKKAFLRKV